MGCRYYSQDTGPFRRKPESIDPPNRSADPQVPPPARNESYQSSFSGATVYGFVNKQFVGCKHLLLDHSPGFIINRQGNIHVGAVGLLSSRHKEIIITLLADFYSKTMNHKAVVDGNRSISRYPLIIGGTNFDTRDLHSVTGVWSIRGSESSARATSRTIARKHNPR